MRILTVATLLALAALSAPGASAQCAEPSALDVDPAARPLLVEKIGGGDLLVSWEGVLASGYRLHRGRLDRLHADQAYDHRVVAETAIPEVVLDDGNRSWYFLAQSDCRADDSGLGRDSGGAERPWGGLIAVRVGLQGGAAVFAVQVSLFFPQGEAFTDDDAVAWLGPFAPGQPGGPLTVANPNLPGEVRAVATFIQTSPDPSFDPPPSPPVDILEVTFGYHGVPPAGTDFTIGDCRVRDIENNDVPGTTCLVSLFDVLF
jgi:hypothetical protein